MCINCTNSYEIQKPWKCKAFPKGIPYDKLAWIDRDPCIVCKNGIGYFPNDTVAESCREYQKTEYELARKLIKEYETKFKKKYTYQPPTYPYVEIFIDDLIIHLERIDTNMTDEDINANIKIARAELNELHLLLPNDEICMELFYFPPFREKTYYAQIIKEENGYFAHVAFTYYADFFGLSSYSQTFECVKSAVNHSAKTGRVICEIKHLDKHLIDTFADIAETYIPDEKAFTGAIIPDGIHGGVRFYENGSVCREIMIHNPSDDTLSNALKNISEEI
jgi:hypothetical protein